MPHLCDGVANLPHPFPALSLAQRSHYFSTKKCNLYFVKEARFDGKLA